MKTLIEAELPQKNCRGYRVGQVVTWMFFIKTNGLRGPGGKIRRDNIRI